MSLAILYFGFIFNQNPSSCQCANEEGSEEGRIILYNNNDRRRVTTPNHVGVNFHASINIFPRRYYLAPPLQIIKYFQIVVDRRGIIAGNYVYKKHPRPELA